jgi:hypothetical protein
MRPTERLVEPRSLSDADTVEMTIFGFVTEYEGYEIALNAMRQLPENYVSTSQAAVFHLTATIALWMQFTYKLDDGPIASNMGRPADTPGDELAASKPVSPRPGSASLLTRSYDSQWEPANFGPSFC